MNCLKHIVIYSRSPSRLLDFFSDVLECEIDFKAQSFHLYQQAFHIKESPLLNQQKTEFHFDVESFEDAEVLMKRFDFYQYRNTDKEFEAIEFKELGNVRILEITDLDSRKWLFVCQKKGYFDSQSF